MMIDRRRFTAAALPACAALLLQPRRAVAAADPWASLPARLAEIETKTGGRLGVAVVDTGTGKSAGYRADERFAMCSSFKFLLAAAVLARVDAGKETLGRRVRYAQSDLVTYSPTSEKHVEDGMSIAGFCEATVTLSDNTAANLLLASIGGPEALTAYVRSVGDAHTRLDRNEPTLNEATPGDPRDTTTPAAMAENLRRLVLADALSPASRAQLSNWLVANKTGDTRLRAGVPAGWRVGDKTGTGGNASFNDIGIVWPPGRPPIIIAAYLTTSKADAAGSNAAIADVARLVAAALTA